MSELSFGDIFIEGLHISYKVENLNDLLSVCVCVCVCTCARGSPDADCFSVDIHHFDRRRNIKDLDTHASSISNRPTPDPRKGYQVVRGSRPSKGKYQKHGLGRKIPKDIWRPALSQVVRA